MSSDNGNGKNGDHRTFQNSGFAKGKPGNPNWVKGVSGNPSGRPRGMSFTEKLRAILPQIPGDDLNGPSHAEEIVRNLIAVAKTPTKLGMMAAKIIADRADPKELAIQIRDSAVEANAMLDRLRIVMPVTVPIDGTNGHSVN